MTDDRRVSECSPLELLEAALSGLDRFGWCRGKWLLEVFVEGGQVRQVRAEVAGDRKTSVGRRRLEHPDGELGSAA